jgi:hypothetical protein
MALAVETDVDALHEAKVRAERSGLLDAVDRSDAVADQIHDRDATAEVEDRRRLAARDGEEEVLLNAERDEIGSMPGIGRGAAGLQRDAPSAATGEASSPDAAPSVTAAPARASSARRDIPVATRAADCNPGSSDDRIATSLRSGSPL